MPTDERKLFLTPLSHFSRKVRIVLEELGIDCEYEYVPDLLSADSSDFGGNPILRVPVLQDGQEWVVESDSIVRYLVEQYDPGNDRFCLFSMSPLQRDALAFISALMGAEVEILLAQRSGIQQVEQLSYFRRYFAVIRNCLSWLESNGSRVWTDPGLSYLDIALICMWDHLRYCKTVETSGRYPWIEEQTAKHRSRHSFETTSPSRMESLQWDLYPSQRPQEPE